MSCETLFFGFECEAAADWTSWEPSPSAPSNYKDPVKIAEYKAKALAELMEEAPYLPLVGQVKKALVIDNSETPRTVVCGNGAAVYGFLTRYLSEHNDVRLVGINIAERIQQCALNAATGHTITHSWGLFANNGNVLPPLYSVRYIDPSRIVAAGATGSARVERLLNWLQAGPYKGVKLTMPFETNPIEQQAQLVRDAAQALGLLTPII